MSDGFYIDVKQAEIALRRLDDCPERMQRARTRLKEVGPKTLGSDGLDDACDTFQNEWEDGIKRIEEISKDLRERLRATIDTYKTAEKTTAEGFGKK